MYRTSLHGLPGCRQHCQDAARCETGLEELAIDRMKIEQGETLVAAGISVERRKSIIRRTCSVCGSEYYCERARGLGYCSSYCRLRAWRLRQRARPRALDLYCGGGGAALGLIEAGFRVTGIDIEDHSRSYPGEFIQGDVFDASLSLADFDLIWASPPCQRFSAGTPLADRELHPDYIDRTRKLLSFHAFTVIENVMTAPIRRDLVLDGPMFGLDLIERRRKFELSWPVLSPRPYRIKRTVPPAPIYRGSMTYQTESYRRWKQRIPGLKWRMPVADARAAMGIPSDSAMTGREVGEAVPPAYALYIGQLARAAMKEAA